AFNRFGSTNFSHLFYKAKFFIQHLCIFDGKAYLFGLFRDCIASQHRTYQNQKSKKQKI
ncbi:MAG: hypothetical protein AVDCRST_MAG74-3825, partial [uncultured Pyrinomonadaceae bacterium]